MSNVIFTDTETTGIHPGRRPWEIAMIKVDQDGHEDLLHLQISDVSLSNADPFGLQVGRFYQRHHMYGNPILPEGCMPVSERHAASLVERFTRRAHLVGAVPSFDAETLDPMLRRYNLIPNWHYHLIDVEPLAIGYLAALHQDGNDTDFEFKLPWKSDELSRAIGVEPPTDEERHTAMGDARWAQRTYNKVMGIN